jgi:hypothetical protein
MAVAKFIAKITHAVHVVILMLYIKEGTHPDICKTEYPNDIIRK